MMAVSSSTVGATEMLLSFGRYGEGNWVGRRREEMPRLRLSSSKVTSLKFDTPVLHSCQGERPSINASEWHGGKQQSNKGGSNTNCTLKMRFDKHKICQKGINETLKYKCQGEDMM